MRVFLACSLLAVSPSAAVAAKKYSGLSHPCKYTYGVGSYQSVSYGGNTSCAEARGVILDLTDNGNRKPKVGKRRANTPHGTWRCKTIRRREVHGVIFSTHRITCRLIDPSSYFARVRFFYES
jgi:hypothetical protein